MEIFELSKKFPQEEKYSLTDQVRRSTRSVCANLAEAFRRRRYTPYFISKMNDAETEVWIYFARDCNYITTKEHADLITKNNKVGKLTWYMINNPEKFR